MTGVADTRLILKLEFPPSIAIAEQVEEFMEKEIAQQLITPSIVLAEFIKYADQRIGEDSASTRLRLLKEKKD